MNRIRVLGERVIQQHDVGDETLDAHLFTPIDRRPRPDVRDQLLVHEAYRGPCRFLGR